MPFDFIKKIAGKLLSKDEEAAAKKAAPTKAAAKQQQGSRKESAARGGDRKDASSGKGGDRPPQRQGGGQQARPGNAPRGRRDGQKPPQGGDGRRQSDGRGHRGAGGGGAPARPAAAPLVPATDKIVATNVTVAPPTRSIGREKVRHRSGEQRKDLHPTGTVRPAQQSSRRRPGGAISLEEIAKRQADHAAWSIDAYQVEPAEGKKRFHDFDLPSELMHAVSDMGFQYCTPIQALSLEHALAGKNVAGKAQTGTGKTAAFLVAILTRYLRSPESRQVQGGAPRALVIAPTRELVIQICKDADTLGKYCALRSLAVYGGMDYERQKREVSDAPVDLLVATPGRLLDFVRSRVVDLSKVDTLVIDEADRMLDMGFIPDVRTIVNRLPPKEKRCTMLYSATLDDSVMRLASQWMEAPVQVEVESEQVTTKTVKQIVYVVTAKEKFTVLYNHIQQYPDSRMLVFCNRRHTTEDVADSLSRRGIRCEMLSGDVNQNRRLRVLEEFREGKVRIVVATDVAGRGLHVDDIGFVVNFDFPYEPEDYVHRIGRTGRAGASGTAISFADEDESFTIPEIEKFIGEELKCTVLQADDALLTKLPPRPPAAVRGGSPASVAAVAQSSGDSENGGAAADETPGGADGGSSRGGGKPRGDGGRRGGNKPRGGSSRGGNARGGSRSSRGGSTEASRPRGAQDGPRPERRPTERPPQASRQPDKPTHTVPVRRVVIAEEWVPGQE